MKPFTISLTISPHYPLVIAGCPTDGVAAIDFRRAHQIPEAPTNSISLAFQHTSESLIRDFPEMVSSQACIEIVSGGCHPKVEWSKVQIGFGAEFAPEVIAALAREPQSDDSVRKLLTAIRAAITAHEQAAAEAQAAQEAKEARAAADTRAAGLAWRAGLDLGTLIDERGTSKAKPHYLGYWAGKSGYPGGLTDGEQTELISQVQALVDAEAAERAAKTAAKLAELRPIMTQTEAEMNDRGVLCLATLRKRLKADAIAGLSAKFGPSWTVVEETHEPKSCPTVAEFEKLRVLESAAGLKGAVDAGGDSYTHGYAFTVKTAEGRAVDVVAYDTADLIQEKDGEEEA